MIEQAVIVCGGRGVRLGALATGIALPLLVVDEAPFLDLLPFELGRHGVRRILLLAGFFAFRFRSDRAGAIMLRWYYELRGRAARSRSRFFNRFPVR